MRPKGRQHNEENKRMPKYHADAQEDILTVSAVTHEGFKALSRQGNDEDI
jgi:hypothetical protein